MNVKDKVIAILEEQLGLPKGEVLLTSTKVSLCMDSLDEVETIMALEEEFDIEINDYQAVKFKSVRDIVDFIKANQLCNTMSALAYNDAKEVFSEVYKGKNLNNIATNKEELYNPVKDIPYAKYLRCTDRLPAKMFNSDQGCLWMYKSSCGKYYYWEEYNCANRVIYRRGEVDWVESNYEKYRVEDENIVEINDFTEHNEFVKDVPVVKDLSQPKTEWTDKHYDFNYTLTENDIEKGVIKIDPYFVSDQWKLGEKDNSGVIFHILKTCSRYKTKHEEEREIRAIYGQIKRLAELRGVKLYEDR